MQPIKTTNTINPAPAKGIESFPTPVIDDVVISEIVNSWKGDYQPLEYGVLWKDVSHAPNQGSFPEHKLVFQQPTSEDGQWVKRIWVNDRVNQDSYNYAIKYSAGSQEHPIYIRTYIVPREGYAPLPDGTPDPLFPTALLVDEEATRNEGELDSKYITVTRVYETLPGPAVPTRRYNERGDLETVIVQTVPPNTPPTVDGLLVTQSQVEQVETGKGVKTTATVTDHALLQIKEKKEGLLGETITTDDIVDPSTNPDPLSTTVVASTVEQYTATKARKRTTTASGPTSLTQKSKDGKLLGDITSTESVVAPNTSPDAVSSTVLSSEVKQVDSGKAIKRNVVLNSTPTLSGNQNEQGLLGNKTTEERIVPAGTAADALSMSVISSAVEPIDSVRSRIVTVESSGPMTLSGGQKKEGLLGETTVAESIVAAGSNPDALSQTVVSSVIEPIDSAKSRKVTITATGPTSLSGGQKKEGLLGETTITEEIVAAGTSPNSLSQTIVSSVVDPIDSFKSKRTTITSTGPTTLAQSSKDGKLLGDVTITESIVDPSATPDSPNSTVLSSEVRQIDSGKSVKRNTTLNSTPTFSGGQTGEGLLGTRTTTETIVASGTSPDAVSLTVISSQVEPIDSVRSRKITTGSTGPTSLTVTSLVDSPVGQVQATVTQSIVGATQVPTGGQFVLQDQISPIDSAKARRERVTVGSYPELTTYDLDENLGVVVITEREVVEESTAYSAPPLVLTLTDKPIDQWKTLRITSRLANIPQDRTEYKTQQFTFPALLKDIKINKFQLGYGRVPISNTATELKAGINQYVAIYPDIRAAVSVPTRIRIVTSFHNGPVAADEVYQIKPQNVSFNGSLFSFNFGDVLCDTETVSVTANQFDQRYGSGGIAGGITLNETVTFPASEPSLTQYTQAINQEKVIFSDVEYYKSNIYVKRTGYVTLI